MHLTLDTYLLVLRRLLPARALLEIAHRHLVECCPTCRAELQAERDGVGLEDPLEALFPPQPAPAPRAAPAPLPEDDRLLGLEHLERRQAVWDQVRRLRARARRHLRHLLDTPPESWSERVRRSRTRYRSRAFAELLLLEARCHLPRQPHRAALLADLVPQVAQRIPRAGEADWLPDLLDQAQRLAQAAAAHRPEGRR